MTVTGSLMEASSFWVSFLSALDALGTQGFSAAETAFQALDFETR